MLPTRGNAARRRDHSAVKQRNTASGKIDLSAIAGM